MKTIRLPLVGLPALLMLLCAIDPVNAQESRRSGRQFETPLVSDAVPPPRRLIDNPTAGVLGRGSFDTELRAFPDGGVLGILQVGLTRHWMIGIAYGGTQIIASHEPRWNPRMQFLTKVQLMGETTALPGIAIGYEDVGFGPWIDSLDRYETKSKGFYAVASKGYRGSGFMSGLHAGINWSREHADHDDDIDVFMGMDLRFESKVGFTVEYNLGLNDDRKDRGFSEGEGYLNAGARWTVLDRVLMEFNLKDILTNRRGSNTIGRELRLIYVERF